jgi:hypothetical protein
MNLPPEEPAAGPWRAEPLATVAATLAGRPTTPGGRPVIVAVDGRSSSGKTSLSRRLAEAVPRRPRVSPRDTFGSTCRLGRCQASTLAMCSGR